MATLEDLIALNDEVALLASAGIPLDSDIVKIGKNRRHELTRINAAVARRVGRGESLVEAVSAEDDSLPELYQNVVEAGLRCGRLPAALEGLCDDSQSLLLLKRRVAMALIYPVLIAALAYGLFVASLLYFLPTLLETYRGLEVPFGPALNLCRELRATLPIWGPIPVVVLLLLIVAWIRGGWQPTFGWTGLLAPLKWLPGIRPLLLDARSATMARLTALLLEHEVPLAESLRLAGGLTGGRRRVSTGATAVDEAVRHAPPLLRWAATLSGPESSGPESSAAERIESFRLAADVYQARVDQRLQQLRRGIPILTLVVLGGGLTLVFVLSVFGPFVQLMQGLM